MHLVQMWRCLRIWSKEGVLEGNTLIPVEVLESSQSLSDCLLMQDMYSGLIGPLVICKKSLARTLGLKKEIEEFAPLFMVFDENESWYLDDNIKAHVKNPPKALKEDEEFIESIKIQIIKTFS